MTNKGKSLKESFPKMPMFVYCPKHGWFSRDEYIGNPFIGVYKWPCLICYKFYPIMIKK